ncbi:TPA: hypothetical protein DDW35_04910 [Candidatus Sumerlaeota bacterium]|nr:hypothetical protein [Candidatus Sumerlaeota bacterium]
MDGKTIEGDPVEVNISLLDHLLGVRYYAVYLLLLLMLLRRANRRLAALWALVPLFAIPATWCFFSKTSDTESFAMLIGLSCPISSLLLVGDWWGHARGERAVLGGATLAAFLSVFYLALMVGKFPISDRLFTLYLISAVIVFLMAAALLMVGCSATRPRFWLRWLGGGVGYILLLMGFGLALVICTEWGSFRINLQFLRQIALQFLVVGLITYAFVSAYLLIIRFCPFHRERFSAMPSQETAPEDLVV